MPDASILRVPPDAVLAAATPLLTLEDRAKAGAAARHNQTLGDVMAEAEGVPLRVLRRTSNEGWPTSLEVGYTNSTTEFAIPPHG